MGDVRDLQVLQNKAAQIVAHKPPFSNRAELFDQLGWMTVAQIIVYHTLLLVFKIRMFGEPEYLAAFLKADNRAGRIVVPNTRLSLFKKSFSLRGSENWNALPESLRTCTKIGDFKRGLKKWIFDNIPRFLE